MSLDLIDKSNFRPRRRLPFYPVYSDKLNEVIEYVNDAIPDTGELAGDSIVGSTGMLAGAPVGSLPNNHIVFFEDFITTYGNIDLGLSNESDPAAVFSEVADRGVWLATIVDGAGGNTETVLGRPADNGVGGWGEFRTCNNDNDAVSCQVNGSSFQIQSGKKLWFETRFLIEDVSETEVFIGLAKDGVTDAYGTAGAGQNDHVGFKLDGDGNLDYTVDQNGTQVTADTGVDFVDGSIATITTTNVVHKCGFYWDGVDTIEFYVDDVKIARLTDNGSTIIFPDDEPVSPVFTILTQGTTDEAIFIDYIYVAQER